MYDSTLSSLSLFVCLNLLPVFSASGQEESGYQLFLKSGTVTPEQNISEKLNQNRNLRTSATDAKSLYIIQFEDLPDDAVKEQLKSAGIELLEYIPNKAYTATVTGNINTDILKSFKARSVLALRPEQKMQQALVSGNLPAYAEKVAGRVDLWLSFPKSFSFEEVKKELLKSNVNIISDNLKSYHVLEVRVDKTGLKSLAASPFVQYLEIIPGEEKPFNDNSRNNSRANVLNSNLSTGFNLEGQGVVIGVGDNADPQQHIDFSGRVINHSGAKDGAHGVHIIGTIAGAGIINEKYKGYAPKSTIVAQISSNIWANAATYVRDYGMVITNNSYGIEINSCNDLGEYTIASSVLDQQAFDFPYLQHVFAAGNSGQLSICQGLSLGFGNVLSGYTAAKNVISVGNETVTGLLDPSSSKGPVKDGRMKPDLSAQGTNVISTIPVDRYTDGTGTSMAAASVSGGLALLYQRYRELHDQHNPQNALMKAILCNGAADLGLSGPDYSFGYGGMNLLRSLKMLNENNYFESEISNNGNKSHAITIPKNTAQLKVMLYWNDPAPSVLSGKTLVNNLDLKVLDADKAEILPVLLNPLNPLAVAGKGVDDLNNMEQIVIDNPAEGNYSLLVKGKLIPQGSQKYVVVYDYIPVSTTLTYPLGQERLVGEEEVLIHWDSYGNKTDVLKVEYSLNNGASWTTINAAVSAEARQITWKIPNAATDKAKVRVTKNDSDLVSESGAFTILGLPALNLSSVQCEGYIATEWAAVSGATDYEIMLLQGKEMKSVTTTTDTRYTLTGLSKDSTYYIAVRARLNGNPGRRSVALVRTPSDGNCAGTISDKDLKIESIISPAKSGRLYTSTELSSSTPVSIRIKNLDDAISDETIQVGYSVGDDNSTIHWETIKPTIQAGGNYDHTFGSTLNLKSIGSYRIKVFVNKPGDAISNNNVITKVFKQLDNAPLTLPFNDQFENLAVQETSSKETGLIGGDRYDFTGSTRYGRLRTVVSSGMSYSGNRALFIDANKNVSTGNVNYLEATFNLSAYDSKTDDIRVSFWFNNYGQKYNDNDKVWIRGKDTDPWIAVDNLYIYHAYAGEEYKRLSIEASKFLNASNQNFTGSFQLRMGQYGERIMVSNYGIAGYGFDDLQISRETNDVSVVEIVQPVSTNFVYHNQKIKAVVRNNSANVLYEIPVKMQVDGGAVTSKTISWIGGNSNLVYEFPESVDLSAPGKHSIKIWTEKKWDSYPDNDAAQTDIFNAPVISSFPYLQNFETNEGDWQSGGKNNSWEYGTPGSGKIKGAASGTKAWKTNLTGHYNDQEISYLYSPGFAISGLANPTLSFSFSMDLKQCQNKLCDFAYVEYSKDGNSWTRLGAKGSGTNWYNVRSDTDAWSMEDYTRWHVGTIPIPSGLGTVRFRFVLQSDDSSHGEGIAIDDIHLYDLKNKIYSSGPASSEITQSNVKGTQWINFIENNKIIASVLPNTIDMGNTVVRTYLNQSSTRNNNSQFYHDRNFTIKPANKSFSDFATVRLYFTDAETESLLGANGCSGCVKPASVCELAISKYSDSRAEMEDGSIDNNLNGNWLLYPAAEIVKVPYDEGYYVEFRTKTFSEFWLAKDNISSGSALPVDLIKFTAQKKTVTDGSEEVLLAWTTAAEKDFSHFEIEAAEEIEDVRQNLFTRIAEINGGSGTGKINQYQYADRRISSGESRYYRLKMIDMDGSFAYSAIRSVAFDNNNAWHIYPNPSSGIFNIDFKAEQNSDAIVKVYDLTGNVLDRQVFPSTGVRQKQQINLSSANIRTGLYFMEVVSGKEKQVFKVLKE